MASNIDDTFFEIKSNLNDNKILYTDFFTLNLKKKLNLSVVCYDKVDVELFSKFANVVSVEDELVGNEVYINPKIEFLDKSKMVIYTLAGYNVDKSVEVSTIYPLTVNGSPQGKIIPLTFSNVNKDQSDDVVFTSNNTFTAMEHFKLLILKLYKGVTQIDLNLYYLIIKPLNLFIKTRPFPITGFIDNNNIDLDLYTDEICSTFNLIDPYNEAGILLINF